MKKKLIKFTSKKKLWKINQNLVTPLLVGQSA